MKHGAFHNESALSSLAKSCVCSDTFNYRKVSRTSAADESNNQKRDILDAEVWPSSDTSRPSSLSLSPHSAFKYLF